MPQEICSQDKLRPTLPLVCDWLNRVREIETIQSINTLMFGHSSLTKPDGRNLQIKAPSSTVNTVNMRSELDKFCKSL